MAQSARESRKTPLSIEPFWERAESDPPIRWEKRRIKAKLAILARENKTLDTILQPKPTHVRLQVEPKYKTTLQDATEETERDRQIRNNQLKLEWEMPKNQGGRRFVWGESTASMRSEVCLTPQYWNGRKTFFNAKVSP